MKEKIEKYLSGNSDFPETLYLNVHDYRLLLLEMGTSVYMMRYIFFRHPRGQTRIDWDLETPIGILDKYIHEQAFNITWNELMKE